MARRKEANRDPGVKPKAIQSEDVRGEQIMLLVDVNLRVAAGCRLGRGTLPVVG